MDDIAIGNKQQKLCSDCQALAPELRFAPLVWPGGRGHGHFHVGGA